MGFTESCRLKRDIGWDEVRYDDVELPSGQIVDRFCGRSRDKEFFGSTQCLPEPRSEFNLPAV